jgi:hypothetical protein
VKVRTILGPCHPLSGACQFQSGVKGPEEHPRTLHLSLPEKVIWLTWTSGTACVPRTGSINVRKNRASLAEEAARRCRQLALQRKVRV